MALTGLRRIPLIRLPYYALSITSHQDMHTRSRRSLTSWSAGSSVCGKGIGAQSMPVTGVI